MQIYAFDRSFEGAIAACGAPLVGILAERLFGFTVAPSLPVSWVHAFYLAGVGACLTILRQMQIKDHGPQHEGSRAIR